MRNFNVAVREWDDQVVFLHQIVPGAADKSYGIHVARLAGVPRPSTSEPAKSCIARSPTSMRPTASLRKSVQRPKNHSPIANGRRRRAQAGNWQMTLFGYEEHPLLDEIRGDQPRRNLDAARSASTSSTLGSSSLASRDCSPDAKR